MDVLALERRRFDQALLVFDLEGSGAPTSATAQDLERSFDQQLAAHWGDQARCIVIEPELDIWLWGGDNALREAFHWTQQGSIRDWSQSQGFALDAEGKPERPKETCEALLMRRQPRSSALYERIASRISLRRCVDPAFLRLRAWFPAVG